MHHVFFCIVPKLLPFFLYYFSRQKIDKFALKVAQLKNFCFLTQTHATNNMTKERESVPVQFYLSG